MSQEEDRIIERRTRDGYEQERVIEKKGTLRVEVVTRLAQLIWLMTGIIVVSIGIRVVLKLLAANPENDFASIIYGFTDTLLTPFAGLINNPATDGGMIFEISSIIAIIVFLILGFFAAELLQILFGASDGSRRVRLIRRRERRD